MFMSSKRCFLYKYHKFLQRIQVQLDLKRLMNLEPSKYLTNYLDFLFFNFERFFDVLIFQLRACIKKLPPPPLPSILWTTNYCFFCLLFRIDSLHHFLSKNFHSEQSHPVCSTPGCILFHKRYNGHIFK